MKSEPDGDDACNEIEILDVSDDEGQVGAGKQFSSLGEGSESRAGSSPAA